MARKSAKNARNQFHRASTLKVAGKEKLPARKPLGGKLGGMPNFARPQRLSIGLLPGGKLKWHCRPGTGTGEGSLVLLFRLGRELAKDGDKNIGNFFQRGRNHNR